MISWYLIKKLTKKAMCDLVVPFRDEYWLTDKEALMIARSEVNVDEIVSIFENAFSRREKEIHERAEAIRQGD